MYNLLEFFLKRSKKCPNTPNPSNEVIWIFQIRDVQNLNMLKPVLIQKLGKDKIDCKESRENGLMLFNRFSNKIKRVGYYFF